LTRTSVAEFPYTPARERVTGCALTIRRDEGVRVPIGFHVTYYHYFDREEFVSDRAWVNFSFEYRY
jgi:hypothetical protein